jgi:lysophospholipase L1-like esterase
VILVGGSTAFGTGVLSDADTFAAALERELSVEVVNSATIGFMAVQELALLQTELLDLRPQVVVAVDGWNDLGIGRSSQIHGLLSEAFVQIEAMTIAGSDVSGSFVAAMGQTASRVFPRTRALLSPRPAPGHRSAAYIAERAQLLARTHAAMAAACRARGCRLVTVLQPHRGDANQYDDFVSQTRAAHQQADLDVFDASRLLDGGADNFLDGYHLTTAGNARLARAVAPIVRSALQAQEARRE